MWGSVSLSAIFSAKEAWHKAKDEQTDERETPLVGSASELKYGPGPWGAGGLLASFLGRQNEALQPIREPALALYCK